MFQFILGRWVHKPALKRIHEAKDMLKKEGKWFENLNEHEQFKLALQIVQAQKSVLQMWRIMWDLVPTVLSLIAIAVAFWK